MGLESATFISQLNAANPVGGLDHYATADDHLRLIKSVLKAQFPNFTAAALNATQARIDAVSAELAQQRMLGRKVGAGTGNAQVMTPSDVAHLLNAGRLISNVAGTNVITGDLDGLTAYYDGLLVLLEPANLNTDAVTLNINSLGAGGIRMFDGATFSRGHELVPGRQYLLVRDGSIWRMLTPVVSSGTVEGVLTGFSAGDQDCTLIWERFNHEVRLRAVTTVTATSDTNDMEFQTLPAEVRPATTRRSLGVGVRDNGVAQLPFLGTVLNTGVVDFHLLSNQGSYTASHPFTTGGTKGVEGLLDFKYRL